MPIGVLFALLAYSAFSLSDAITKGFTGGPLSVFEITFFINVFCMVTLPLAKRKEDKWSEIFKLRHPVLMNARALLYTGASLGFYFAVTHVPFAESYTLAFLAPLFVTFLSLIILHEKVAALRWVFVALTFVGVLIVVRPGFREIQLGHLAALGCAICSASANVILRVISNRERQISIVAMNGVYQLVVSGTLMLQGFVVPSIDQLARLAVVGIIAGISQLLIIRAMQTTPASHIGPTQYVQIVWAVVLGALFFHEGQDAIGYVGLALLILSGVATIFSDGAQARISGRWTEYRARRNEPVINRVEGPEI